MIVFFFFKQKTAYEMRISDWSSDVCSSDLRVGRSLHGLAWYACLLAQHGRRLRTQGYDLLLASWGYPDAVGTRWLARRLGLPYVVKVHGSDLNALAPSGMRRRQVVTALHDAAAVISVSRALDRKSTRLNSSH